MGQLVELQNPNLMIYVSLLVAVWVIYLTGKSRIYRKNLMKRMENLEAGIDEPPTLHPVFNHNRCLGCGSCAAACPEKDAIGIIGGKAYLVNPGNCIGHGVCKIACPQDAITLVFGSPNRGIDIPLVNSDMETNVPGVFIAGELSGIGLIKNAIEQGKKAIDSIVRKYGRGSGDVLDVVIVGAGPAGFSASLAAKERGLNYVTIEQDTLGGTVAHYPKGKVVMTSPVVIPMVGKLAVREIPKENLLSMWMNIEKKYGLNIRYRERTIQVKREGDHFLVVTSRGFYRAKTVLLAIGLRGTPRKLGVPGEELPKVVYRLEDPEQYAGKKVLVVGGGDSALEAAMSVATVEGTEVTLAHRSNNFVRAKSKNREKLERMRRAGKLQVMLQAVVKRIERDSVVLDVKGKVTTIENDHVIVCIGGVPPTDFLNKIGIRVETKYGTP